MYVDQSPYHYVMNNPVSYTDPDGMKCDQCGTVSLDNMFDPSQIPQKMYKYAPFVLDGGFSSMGGSHVTQTGPTWKPDANKNLIA